MLLCYFAAFLLVTKSLYFATCKGTVLNFAPESQVDVIDISCQFLSKTHLHSLNVCSLYVEETQAVFLLLEFEFLHEVNNSRGMNVVAFDLAVLP